MGELNVEKIMEEIRSEIREKGYTSDILSFKDVTIEDPGIDTEKFEYDNFNAELFCLNSNWNVNPNRDIVRKPGLKGKCVTIFKKIIRKCIRFYLTPIVFEQDFFNATTVRLFNMLNLYVEENGKLSDEIEELKIEQKALRDEISKLRDKSA